MNKWRDITMLTTKMTQSRVTRSVVELRRFLLRGGERLVVVDPGCRIGLRQYAGKALHRGDVCLASVLNEGTRPTAPLPAASADAS